MQEGTFRPSTDEYDHLPEVWDDAGGKGTGIASNWFVVGPGHRFTRYSLFCEFAKISIIFVPLMIVNDGNNF